MNLLKHVFFLLLMTTILPFAYSQDCLIDVNVQDEVITVLNLQQHANAKLFDANIQVVWGCDQWNGNPCTSQEEIAALTVGATYYLSIQSDACEEWIPIVIGENGPVATCSDGIQNQGELGIDCGGPCASCPGNQCNVTASSQFGLVQIFGLTETANTKLFTEDFATVWACNQWSGSPCNSQEIITALQVGTTYYLSVQSDVCSEWIPITVIESETCPDLDGDSICDFLDCVPDDATLPGVSGAPCDDLNDLTENDVISADGCSCAGTLIEPSNCNVFASSSNGNVFVVDLPSNANTKLFDADLNVVWGCDPWNGNPCTEEEIVTNLVIGANYFLSVQSNSCDIWQSITIEGEVTLPDCSSSLGDFQSASCFEFLENGSLRFNVTTENDEYSTRWVDELGKFNSSTPATKANTIEIEADQIIEKNHLGTIINEVVIDPFIISQFQNGGKLDKVARFSTDQFVLVGGFPIGGAGNEPFVDQLYVYLIDADGNMLTSELFGQINYTEQDYQTYGGNFYSIEGVVPTAHGTGNPVALEVYVENFQSGVVSDLIGSITRYDLNANLAILNTTILKSNSTNKFLNIIVNEDDCKNDVYNIVCISDDFTTGIQEVIEERIDHSNELPVLRSRITTSSDGTTSNYLLEVDGFSTGVLRVFRSVPIAEPIFPGEFTYGEVGSGGNFMINGTIMLNEPPVSVYKFANGEYNFVTEINGNPTWYTTSCQEKPDNDTQHFEAEITENTFTLNELFPNPATDEVFLKLESFINTSVQVQIHDMTGIKVFAKNLALEIGINTFDIQIDRFNTGIYNISILSNDDEIQSKRFIKK